MNQRYANSPQEVAKMNTEEIRNNFLIEDLMWHDKFSFTYSHYDRAIVGSVVPASKILELPNFDNLRSEYFLERRELGIINVGGPGEIVADDESFKINKLDAVYVGMGTKSITFKSVSQDDPAKLYLFSTPAHQSYPSALIKKEEAAPVNIGSKETANERSIYKYIYLQGKRSCQLVMGLTLLHPGSVWNTMPSHTHDRRMEAYFYFDLPSDQVVFHYMGQPQETRHLVVQNDQAILSPPWSIHSGCGTSNYGFIWAMAGENQDYADMDPVLVKDLR
ncbi:5-dehydro-4-deoxy-D-glucuronate isomerase [Daejeonella lutea]|uniref:4-deoxy-L-threo-5-hexosulose-uronate ketol-isomerase n=1 Tax=Daejeonella lutea TaxID=572036 RepID=A0A1T5EC77_9SPHI|nr:5-dehydro-4-deoxy-D-glucuronate isomerase [Daejeonella lutea]SKB81410.1 4-deoxy-L-threo-5-hexosulose-uronate ketol-isomerase [Daejeonella lutea]